MNYLKSYCRIKQGLVIINGQTVHSLDDGKHNLSELYDLLDIDYRKFYKMDALSKLGFLASELTLKGFERDTPKLDMAITLFNRSASLEADDRYMQTIRDRDHFYPSPADFVYTLPNIVTGEIAIRNKIFGETAFYVLDSFRSDLICDMVNFTHRFASMRYVLTGWVEVSPFSDEYDCLMWLSIDDAKDDNGANSNYVLLSAANLNDLYINN